MKYFTCLLFGLCVVLLLQKITPEPPKVRYSGVSEQLQNAKLPEELECLPLDEMYCCRESEVEYWDGHPVCELWCYNPKAQSL